LSNKQMTAVEIYVPCCQCYNGDEFKERVAKPVSKEKWKNRKAALATARSTQNSTPPRKLTPEEAGALVRDRLANRPVIVWRYRNGKWNKRFIITLAIMIIALAAAVYYLTRV
jgi:hypothetical protein